MQLCNKMRSLRGWTCFARPGESKFYQWVYAYEIKKSGYPKTVAGPLQYIVIHYFNAAIEALIAAIFSVASLCFLCSRAITCSGALATNRSFESFFSTPARKPS